MIPLDALSEVAAYAAGAALIITIGGFTTLHRLRHRSISVQLAVVVATTVLAILAGIIAITLDMMISGHDRSVALTVVAVDGVAGLGVSLFLGRRLAAAHRAVAAGVRSEPYAPPERPLTAELTVLTRELAATRSRLTASHDRERDLATSRRELIAWISHDLRVPLARLHAAAEAITTDPDSARHRYGVVRAEAERLSSLVDELFDLSFDSAANSAMPSSNSTEAVNPSSVRALSGDATT